MKLSPIERRRSEFLKFGAGMGFLASELVTRDMHDLLITVRALKRALLALTREVTWMLARGECQDTERLQAAVERAQNEVAKVEDDG